MTRGLREPGGGIVVGQHIALCKRERAVGLRQEMTPGERVLWQHLRRNQLAGLHFRRQQVIDGFIVDFYCHAGRLVVEVDGSSHEGREGYDAERDGILAARGLRVLRVSEAEVHHRLTAVLARIAEASSAPLQHSSRSTSPLPAPGRGTGG